MGNTIGEQFVAWSLDDPGRTFTRRHTGTDVVPHGYGEAALLAAGIVEQLRGAGLARGDRVAFYLDDVWQSIYGFVACACAGIAPVPLAPVHTPRYLDKLVAAAGCKAVFTTPEHAARITALGVPVLTWAQQPLACTHADAIAILRADLPDADELFMIQPSSGTTGDPKLMLRSHRPMIRTSIRLRFEHAGIPGVPLRRLMSNALTHGAGVIDFCGVIGAGAEACVTSRPNVDVSLDEVRALDPHVVVLVPRILNVLYQQHVRQARDPARERMFGPSLRMIHYGGAPLAPELKQFFRAQQLDVLELYGCTECGIMAMSRPDEQRDGWAKIMDDMELRVAGDGEIQARSPVIMRGYLGDEELTRASFTADGFYRTGDLGAIDDGWVQIRGRKKDVFGTMTGGIVFPSRIEDMLEAVPGIEQAALFGSGRPFLVALIHTALPADAVRDHLRRINVDLEPEERVHRFHLLREPLPADCYVQVGQGKARRDRVAIAKAFAAVFDALYSAESSDGSRV